MIITVAIAAPVMIPGLLPELAMLELPSKFGVEAIFKALDFGLLWVFVDNNLVAKMVGALVAVLMLVNLDVERMGLDIVVLFNATENWQM